MRIAVITGASSGIGREFVYAVDRQEQFDEIWVIARRRERLEELQAVCRNRIRPVPLDLAELKNVDGYAALLAAEQPELRADDVVLRLELAPCFLQKLRFPQSGLYRALQQGPAKPQMGNRPPDHHRQKAHGP